MPTTSPRSSRSSSRSRSLRLAVAATVVATACAAEPIALQSSVDALTPCPGVTAVDIDRQVTVRLLVGPGIAADEATALVADGAAVFKDLGLELRLGRIGRVSNETILGGSLAEVERRARTEATSVDSDRGTEIAIDVALAPIRAFLRRTAVPPQARVDVVVLPRLTASASTALFGDIAGIAISPEITDDLPRRGLPNAFTPTAFLDFEALMGLDASQAAVVVAHELAHSLGLRHDQRQWNLMNPAPQACRPGLDAEQVATIRSSPVVRP